VRLAYLYPEHLGRPAARLLQAAATLRALLRQGAQVHLLAGRFVGLEKRLEELGLGPSSGLVLEPLPMWQPGPGLHLPFPWHGPYHRAARAVLAKLSLQGVVWALVRHLKLADFLLKQNKGRPRLLFEAHELFSQTAREEGVQAGSVAKLKAMEARVFARAERLVAISAPLALALQDLPGVRRPVAVAPSGVEESFFAVEGAARESGLVAYAGGLGTWKGVDLLLRAVALLPGARLEMLGGWPGSEGWLRLTSLAGELGLGERLLMRPQAGQEAVRELLGRAAAAVWPGSACQRIAAEFTSPLKLFEYLAAGCAVAAPDLPAARAVVADGRQALLFTPDDPQLLAGVLHRLLEDRALAAELGRAGRELARLYTWDQRTATLLRLMLEGD
jgi:glycosyltransferase involved in cell wall biosynthesis